MHLGQTICQRRPICCRRQPHGAPKTQPSFTAKQMRHLSNPGTAKISARHALKLVSWFSDNVVCSGSNKHQQKQSRTLCVLDGWYSGEKLLMRLRLVGQPLLHKRTVAYGHTQTTLLFFFGPSPLHGSAPMVSRSSGLVTARFQTLVFPRFTWTPANMASDCLSWMEISPTREGSQRM